MSGYDQGQATTEILAIGINGHSTSLCGAVKRFQLNGQQSNGLLTLKEQCARRIALIKNEQLKCFITAYLPPNLFKYVTKDIFDLRRYEFTSNYADDLNICEVCSFVPGEKTRRKCRCLRMKTAIHELNKYLFQRMNNENTEKTTKTRKFKLFYKKLKNEESYWNKKENELASYFLYLSPCEFYNKLGIYDTDELSFEEYQSINGQVSIQDKLLFVDAMGFFGGFQTNQEQPQLILYRSNQY